VSQRLKPRLHLMRPAFAGPGFARIVKSLLESVVRVVGGMMARLIKYIAPNGVQSIAVHGECAAARIIHETSSRKLGFRSESRTRAEQRSEAH
jgi:hypothetical protein